MIKFPVTSTPVAQIAIADTDLLTLVGDLALGIDLTLEGAVSATVPQLVYRTGAATETGGLVLLMNPTDHTSNAGMFIFQINGGSTSRCVIGPIEAGASYTLVLNRANGIWTSKLCPTLTSAPVDGSAVLSSASYTLASDLNGLAGLIFGNHSLANRRFNNSMGRFFRIDRALSDYEIAQLAYGKEISEIKAPLNYLKMSGPTDYADTGTQALAVTAQGDLTQGTSPPYGYNSVPTAPSITGTPVITGSPTPGTAVGYTPAQILGNPPPTTSQQWTLDGVDIADATGATYTPVAGNVGKLLRVRQIASNGVGSPATATSDPVTVAAGAVTMTPAEFGMDEFGNEAFFQQVNDVASVPVSVAYSGTTPAKLEYQLYEPDGVTIALPWTDTGLTPSGAAFSGNVPMPALTAGRRKNKIRYRLVDSNGTAIITSALMRSRFGIGNAYIGIGSSSMAAWFTDGSGTGMVVNHDSVSTGAQDHIKPFTTDGRASQMAEYISEKTGYPVAFLGMGLGGSTLSSWADASSTSTFGLFKQAVTMVGGKIAGVFSTCGSNDITGSNGALSIQAHLDLLRQLATNIRSFTGQASLPILLSGINRRTNANSDAQANNARAAERAFGSELNNYYVQTLDFELSGDGTHLTGAGYAACCARVQYVWIEAVKNGIYRRGPKITSLRFSGNEFNVQLAHRSGNDFTPLSGITGFIVTDNKGDGVQVPVVVTSCTRTNAGNIKGVCDQVLVAPTITYLAGMGPEVGTPVYDNGPATLPMEAEPFMLASAGAIEQPLVLVPYYNEYTISRAILGSGDAPLTGSFTTYQLTSSGTLRTSQACKYTWYASGVIGITAGDATMGEKPTNADGRLALTGLPFGAGMLVMKFADGGVAYQEGTVA